MDRKGGRQHNSTLSKEIITALQTTKPLATVSMMEMWRHAAQHAAVPVSPHLVDPFTLTLLFRLVADWLCSTTQVWSTLSSASDIECTSASLLFKLVSALPMTVSQGTVCAKCGTSAIWTVSGWVSPCSTAASISDGPSHAQDLQTTLSRGHVVRDVGPWHTPQSLLFAMCIL